MKSAEGRSHGDLAEPLNGTTERCIFGDGEMRPKVIVIGGVGSKDSAHMSFAEDDDVIEAFPRIEPISPHARSARVNVGTSGDR